MFAGIGVFDDELLTETIAAIPVNALEFDAIVIALLGSVMDANKLHPWKVLVPMEGTLVPKTTFVTLVLSKKYILSDALELVYV
jgi:hypothetical protein